MVQDTRRPVHVRNFSTPGYRPTSSERQPLIRRHSFDEYDISPEDDVPRTSLAGGTVLGIHNLAIVMPQFVVCISGTVKLEHDLILALGGHSDEYNFQNRRWNRYPGVCEGHKYVSR